MRNLSRLFAVLALVSLTAGVASAREIESSYDGEGNTSLSAVPTRTTSMSMRKPRAKDVGTIPAKYDSAFPVRDYAHATRDRGAI